VSQVLDRNTVLRFNYAYSRSSGYLTDPYKILSLVDAVTGQTLSRTPAAGRRGPSGVYLYESRPDSHVKQSVYGELKRNFGGKVLNLSYRYATDDWNITSHTAEARLRWPMGSGYLEPHLRWYTQSAAEFYRTSLIGGQPLPQYASSDSRLGNFDGLTTGLKYGRLLNNGAEWNVRLEYYQQSGKVPASLNAVIAQVGYRFGL
jgi:Protein of unknown function (DUF3570)